MPESYQVRGLERFAGKIPQELVSCYDCGSLVWVPKDRELTPILCVKCLEYRKRSKNDGSYLRNSQHDTPSRGSSRNQSTNQKAKVSLDPQVEGLLNETVKRTP